MEFHSHLNANGPLDLGRGYADSDDQRRRYIHSSEHQFLTDSPRFHRRFNGTIQQQRDKQQQYQQHQRRGRSWREEEEMHNRDEPEDEEFLEDEELVFNRFDDVDDAPFDWSEGLGYTSSANLRNRRLRHSDPIGRNAKSMELTGRRSGGSAERDYRTRRPERKISKRGKIFIYIHYNHNCTAKRHK